MLDQSFSFDNFRKIIDQENRKGNYLEKLFFPDVVTVTEKIRACNLEIKEKYRTDPSGAWKEALNQKKENLEAEKEALLQKNLGAVSQNIEKKSFKIALIKKEKPGEKPVYSADQTAECYFAIKQVQSNVSKLFSVKQSNRFSIVGQVQNLLNDSFPKYILRTDIKEFYESIPHEFLLRRIYENNLLSSLSRKILKNILDEYKNKSGSDRGVPRGVGVSAHLAELYMKDVDRHISALPDVTYYARYVDDIVVIFTPKSVGKGCWKSLRRLKEIIEKKHGLKLNKDKTEFFDLVNHTKQHSIDYLGYKISFGTGPVKLSLSKRKMERYKKRIDIAFDDYLSLNPKNEKSARSILEKRIRFLTGNTRLKNNKKNILVGVYYSNVHLTDPGCLAGLDAYLKNKIQTSTLLDRVKNRLLKYSFETGFEKRRFSPFTHQELRAIMQDWSSKNG